MQYSVHVCCAAIALQCVLLSTSIVLLNCSAYLKGSVLCFLRIAGSGIQHSPSMQEASMPFSCLPQLQQQPQQLPSTPKQQQQDAAWDGSSGRQLTAAEQKEQLFAMPAVYQPRVKDLEAPDFSSMLSGEEGLCSLGAEAATIAVPVVEPVEVSTAVVSLPVCASLCFLLSANGMLVCCNASILAPHVGKAGLLLCWCCQWSICAAMLTSVVRCSALLCIAAGGGNGGEQQPHCPQASPQHTIQL
jgi:hypothetical protein